VARLYHATNDLSGEFRARTPSKSQASTGMWSESPWLNRHSLLWNLVTKNLYVLSAQSSAKATVSSNAASALDVETLGDRFRSDLTQLVRQARRTGAVVVLVTFSTHPRAGQSPADADRAMASARLYMPGIPHGLLVAAYARYNAIIRDVARAEDVVLVGDGDSIPGDPEHFRDSVHFADAGSLRQADRVANALPRNPGVLRRIQIAAKR
jgi:hypothetical protein